MIPSFKLNNGIIIPAQGLGTFTLNAKTTTISIDAAFESGCTLIDTASAYGTEQFLGSSVKELKKKVFSKEKIYLLRRKLVTK